MKIIKVSSSYDLWKTTPDDYWDDDAPECPECDAEMEQDGYAGKYKGKTYYNWKCSREDCNGYIDNDWS